MHLSPLLFEVLIGTDDLTLQARFDGDVFGMVSLSRPNSVCLRFELVFFFLMCDSKGRMAYETKVTNLK